MDPYYLEVARCRGGGAVALTSCQDHEASDCTRSAK